MEDKVIKLINNNIKELKEIKSNYYELLDNSIIYSENYIVSQIRSCRDQIDILENILEELKGSE